MSALLAYWPSLAGGMLIGLSAALLLLLGDGRVAGISGIAARLPGPIGAETTWRLAFLVGLLLGPLCIALLSGHVPQVTITASYPVLMVAGLLVGFGTRLGSGCTSGHGVCGLSRLSPRSAVAVVTFMATAIATVFLARHVVDTGPCAASSAQDRPPGSVEATTSCATSSAPAPTTTNTSPPAIAGCASFA